MFLPEIMWVTLYYYLIFVYVGKIHSLRQVLLNSRLHFSLVTLAETFSISRTDFRRSDGCRKMREPTDMFNFCKYFSWTLYIDKGGWRKYLKFIFFHAGLACRDAGPAWIFFCPKCRQNTTGKSHQVWIHYFNDVCFSINRIQSSMIASVLDD